MDDVILNGSTATFDLNETGAVEGKYTGTFTFRCFLTPLQQLAAGREYREILGKHPENATEHESFLAYAITQLKYRIIKAPPFWTSATSSGFDGNIPDDNVIAVVLNAAVNAELQYKKQMKQKREDSIKVAKQAAERLLDEQTGDVKES